jgi:hypothetical protein
MSNRLYRTRGLWAYLRKRLLQLPLLLDNISSAACYSLRKLRTAYTGPAIRVRRSSDNAELDIGFTSTGGLDIDTLLAFVGTGNGFVTTWYDQSGNGRDATMTTATLQPQIVSNGVILTHQGKPTLSFDGEDDYLTHTLNLAGESTVSAVVNSFGLRPGGVASTVFSTTAPNTRVDNLMYSKMPFVPEWGSYGSGALISGITVGNNYSILEVISNNPPTGLVQLYTNGVFSAELAGRYGGDFQTRQALGAEHSWGGNNHYGYIAEVIAVPSVLSTTDRQLIKVNQMSYYSILGALSIPSIDLPPLTNSGLPPKNLEPVTYLGLPFLPPIVSNGGFTLIPPTNE